MINIRKLEAELWESADLLRQGSKLTSNQYCMPVLGLIFLRYAYSRFKKVEAEILKGRPSRGGRVMPVEASDFAAKSALFLPKEAQYSYLLGLPEDIKAADLCNKDGHKMNSLGEVVNNAMQLMVSFPKATPIFVMKFFLNFFVFLTTVLLMKSAVISLVVSTSTS